MVSQKRVRGFVQAMLAVVGLAYMSASYALFEEDIHISGDKDSISLALDSRTFNEIRDFIRNGYPAQSIYLHGIGLGISIDDLVFLMARADPDNTDEYVNIAIDMLPFLPSWACRSGVMDRYAPNDYSPGQLPEVASLQDIADRFFENNERLSPFPDWSNNNVHANVPTAEVQQYLNPEYWYNVGRNDRPVNEGIMVSLYKHDNSIVVDGNLGQLQQAIQNGVATVPIVVIYNETFQRPISAFGSDVTTGQVIDAFSNDQTQITMVPNWQGSYGDYHHIADIDELEQYVELPAKEDVEASLWQAMQVELTRSGYSENPVIVMLYGQQVWIDEPERLAAAKDLGVTEVPVIYLYHSIDRLPCGIAPGRDCEDRIRRAAGVKQSTGASSSGQNNIIPPPPSLGSNPSPS